MAETTGRLNAIAMMLEGLCMERPSSSLSTETLGFTFLLTSNLNIQSTIAEDVPLSVILRLAVSEVK